MQNIGFVCMHMHECVNSQVTGATNCKVSGLVPGKNHFGIVEEDMHFTHIVTVKLSVRTYS